MRTIYIVTTAEDGTRHEHGIFEDEEIASEVATRTGGTVWPWLVIDSIDLWEQLIIGGLAAKYDRTEGR